MVATIRSLSQRNEDALGIVVHDRVTFSVCGIRRKLFGNHGGVKAVYRTGPRPPNNLKACFTNSAYTDRTSFRSALQSLRIGSVGTSSIKSFCDGLTSSMTPSPPWTKSTLSSWCRLLLNHCGMRSFLILKSDRDSPALDSQPYGVKTWLEKLSESVLLKCGMPSPISGRNLLQYRTQNNE